jgi:hypothetical protein
LGDRGWPGCAGAFCTFDKHRRAALLRGIDQASPNFIGGQAAVGVGDRQTERRAIDVENPPRKGEVLRQRQDRRFDMNSPDRRFHVTTRPHPVLLNSHRAEEVHSSFKNCAFAALRREKVAKLPDQPSRWWR